MNTLEHFGAHVAGAAAAGLSNPVRELLRLHLADTVAAWVAGAHTHEGRELLAVAAKGDAGPMGAGLMGRVMLHCAVTRLSEIDDIHLAAGTTPGAVIVPAALSIAAALGDTGGAALEEAVCAGYDAMVRLGEEMGGASILYRGIWPTYFNAPFGAAAVASRLLGLDDKRTAHALGLALVVASPNVGQQSGKMARWLLLGAAARNGVMAALAAQEGFTADLALLDKPFHSVYGLTIDGARLLANLGKRAAVLDVAFKPWCAARQTMAAAQGLKELLEEGLDPSGIEAIKVAVPPAYLGMVNHGVIPGERGSHMTSLPYQLVLAALAPETMYRLDYAPAPTPAEHQALLARISVEADEKLMEYFPRAWPASIEVRARAGGGQRLVTEIPGDAGRPLDESQIRDKCRRVFSPLLAAPSAVSLCDAALGVLDRPEGVNKLLQQIESCYPR
ncbi:MAG: hypothetical protein A3H35_20530 [Betaproteobacteria bacterium RIFCSPLOWO2_02_FULL_62_17]|nr:MAG: hypothetical protein A3H35_20530 [Betaproteobacteria bacterium RIFCSPLOWO2_02_FULL_62_17]